jgi:hypothetical protein
MTKAGASFLVMSATNTISGFLIRIFTSHFIGSCTSTNIEIKIKTLIHVFAILFMSNLLLMTKC